MGRDSNPDHPGEDGVWFRVRKDGNFVDVPPVAREKSDSTMGWMPLSSFPGDTTTASDVLGGVGEVSLGDKYESLYLDESSTTPADDDDSVDLDQYGLTQSNPIVLEVKKDDDDNTDNGNNGNNDNGDNGGNDNGNNDNSNNENSNDQNNDDGRDYPSNYPNTKGYWFVVQDENGDNIDVSSGATEVNNGEPTLGWNPLPKDPDLPSDIWHAGASLVKGEICNSLNLNPQDYQVYTSQEDKASDFIGDNFVIDFRTVGQKGNNPMMVKYYIVNDSVGGSDDQGDGQDNTGNSGGDNTANADPYINFTKRLQNITTGDWSIYPEAISTYPGEILWTDGNPSHSFASAPNILAYGVVKRSPSVYNGRVIQTGLAAANDYYFKLLD